MLDKLLQKGLTGNFVTVICNKKWNLWFTKALYFITIFRYWSIVTMIQSDHKVLNSLSFDV